MQVLVTYGAGPDSTLAVARALAEALESAGLRAVALPCREAGGILPAFDAVVVGGPLEGGSWPLGLRWFVWRWAAQLRRLPVWFFSDAPSAEPDGEPDRAAPSASVGALMGRAGARGHATFGRLPPAAPAPGGAPFGRGRDRVQAWALDLARELGRAARSASGAGAP